MNRKGWVGLVVVIVILLVVGFFWFVRDYGFGDKESITNNDSSQLANPASVYCVDQGNRLEIRDEAGGQAGYCISSDGQECEEWSFYRGDCSFEY